MIHGAFDPARLFDRLARGPVAIRSAASVFGDDDARWRPDGRSWSVLEIVCHLADEERADFPVRLLALLSDPSEPWAGIDPAGWAAERAYQSRDLHHELDAFADERARALSRVRAIAHPDWASHRDHPELGRLRAGDLLGAWAAHDALHLRQIAKRAHQLAARDAGGFGIAYAGNW